MGKIKSEYKQFIIRVVPKNKEIRLLFVLNILTDKNKFRNFIESRVFAQIGDKKIHLKNRFERVYFKPKSNTIASIEETILSPDFFKGKITSKNQNLFWNFDFDEKLPVEQNVFSKLLNQTIFKNTEIRILNKPINAHGFITIDNEQIDIEEAKLTFRFLKQKKAPFELHESFSDGITESNNNFTMNTVALRPYSKLSVLFKSIEIDYANMRFYFDSAKTPFSMKTSKHNVNSWKLELLQNDYKFKIDFFSHNRDFIGTTIDDTRGDFSFFYFSGRGKFHVSIFKNERVVDQFETDKFQNNMLTKKKNLYIPTIN